MEACVTEVKRGDWFELHSGQWRVVASKPDGWSNGDVFPLLCVPSKLGSGSQVVVVVSAERIAHP